MLRALSLCTCCRQYPGAATGRRLRSSHPAVSAFPELQSGRPAHRPFRACSAFTRVAARTLAPSPICDQLHRRLQPFRHLHDCSGCFRLERSPGGAYTHWKAPPSHTAHANSGRSISARRARPEVQGRAQRRVHALYEAGHASPKLMLHGTQFADTPIAYHAWELPS